MTEEAAWTRTMVLWLGGAIGQLVDSLIQVVMAWSWTRLDSTWKQCNGDRIVALSSSYHSLRWSITEASYLSYLTISKFLAFCDSTTQSFYCLKCVSSTPTDLHTERDEACLLHWFLGKLGRFSDS